jgi:signal transduction histidine kinase
MRGFAAVAAHDLRSPVASIVGFSTLLTENWATFSEEDRWKAVATIDRQSRNLSRLVDDLLTLSSIEGGVLNTRPELIVLRQAIDLCLEAGGGDSASVSVSCSPDLVVRVDPHDVGRILDNYVQNAFKYGEPPVRIEATRVGDAVEVRVLDHGPGVPPEFVPRLFGKFARAGIPSTRAEKGSGLGLSIVRGLAEANGGQARYEPNAPNGACFVVRLRAGDEPGG